MPIETSAAVLRAFGEPQPVEPVVLRDPGPGEVLVRMVAAGVCHSDVGQADGEWDHVLPVVLGHEGAGVIEALGPGVDGVAVGQRVVLSLAPGCGHCHHCAVGRPILCQDALDAMGEGRLVDAASPITTPDGSTIAAYSLLSCFARHTVVSARSVIPLPDGVPASVAALVGCAVITGVGAAIETLRVRAGSRGAVVGAGGVGLNAVQGARISGAETILAIDPDAGRREAAQRFGATDGIDPGDRDAIDHLCGRARRDGLDWTIVTVGNPDAMRLGIELLRPGGTACMVGLAPQDRPIPVDMLDLVTFERRIVGSAYGSLTPRVQMPRILDLYRSGQLRLDAFDDDPLPLEQIDEAFERSRRARGLRPVLALSDGGRFA